MRRSPRTSASGSRPPQREAVDLTPTRSAVLELAEERRAMHEGHVFLEEKCLLLASEMLRELRRHGLLRQAFAAAWEDAIAWLQAAVARHGLEGVQLQPPAELAGVRLVVAARSLMGVHLQEAEVAGEPAAPPPAVDPSPEAHACRQAFARLLDCALPLAAVSGNLERLHQEDRRAVRRARALQDVLLPELDRTIREIETRLSELEQEDAIWMRCGAGR
jgi:V/A-type H+-transporting ATPase subunit D